MVKLGGRRKIMLANRIPGPEGMFLVGLLPKVLQGPEKLIPNMLVIYRK